MHGVLGLLVGLALTQIAIATFVAPVLLLGIPVLELWCRSRRQSLDGAVLSFYPGRWQLNLAGQIYFVRPSRGTLCLPFCVRLTLLEAGEGIHPARRKRWSCILFNDAAEPMTLRYLRRQLNLQ